MSPTFPRRITLDLAPFHQQGLAEIASRLPFEDAQELLTVVISRGIVEMLGSPSLPSSSEEIAENMHAAEERMRELRPTDISPESKLILRAQTIGPSPAPFGMKQSLREQHAMEAEHDDEVARMRRDLGLADTADGQTTPSRQVENYIGVPLSEGLRRGVESMLKAHPNLEEENLYSALLELGLKTVQEDPKTLQPWAAAQKAALGLNTKQASRQRLRAEWKELCQNVARGWR